MLGPWNALCCFRNPRIPDLPRSCGNYLSHDATSPDGAKEGSRGRSESLSAPVWASKPPEPTPPICRRRAGFSVRLDLTDGGMAGRARRRGVVVSGHRFFMQETSQSNSARYNPATLEGAKDGLVRIRISPLCLGRPASSQRSPSDGQACQEGPHHYPRADRRPADRLHVLGQGLVRESGIL